MRHGAGNKKTKKNGLRPNPKRSTPPKFNSSPLKMVVGRPLSYWEGKFSGAVLNFGRVKPESIVKQFVSFINLENSRCCSFDPQSLPQNQQSSCLQKIGTFVWFPRKVHILTDRNHREPNAILCSDHLGSGKWSFSAHECSSRSAPARYSKFEL